MHLLGMAIAIISLLLLQQNVLASSKDLDYTPYDHKTDPFGPRLVRKIPYTEKGQKKVRIVWGKDEQAHERERLKKERSARRSESTGLLPSYVRGKSSRDSKKEIIDENLRRTTSNIEKAMAGLSMDGTSKGSSHSNDHNNSLFTYSPFDKHSSRHAPSSSSDERGKTDKKGKFSGTKAPDLSASSRRTYKP